MPPGYGGSELTRLQIPDIDSRRMVIHIRGGKGASGPRCHGSVPRLLKALRDYWRGLKRKTHGMVIPGRNPGTPPIVPSLLEPCVGMPANVLPSRAGLFRTGFIPTPCATVLQLTY